MAKLAHSLLVNIAERAPSHVHVQQHGGGNSRHNHHASDGINTHGRLRKTGNSTSSDSRACENPYYRDRRGFERTSPAQAASGNASIHSHRVAQRASGSGPGTTSSSTTRSFHVESKLPHALRVMRTLPSYVKQHPFNASGTQTTRHASGAHVPGIDQLAIQHHSSRLPRAGSESRQAGRHLDIVIPVAENTLPPILEPSTSSLSGTSPLDSTSANTGTSSRSRSTSCTNSVGAPSTGRSSSMEHSISSHSEVPGRASRTRSDSRSGTDTASAASSETDGSGERLPRKERVARHQI